MPDATVSSKARAKLANKAGVLHINIRWLHSLKKSFLTRFSPLLCGLAEEKKNCINSHKKHNIECAEGVDIRLLNNEADLMPFFIHSLLCLCRAGNFQSSEAISMLTLFISQIKKNRIKFADSFLSLLLVFARAFLA